MVKEFLLAPLSWMYGAAVTFRHKLFDWKVLRSTEYDLPIVCVGNIGVGGTGKTPHTEFLIDFLSHYYSVAVLSRGYGRTTKGFILSEKDSSFKTIGDEPKQIKRKFPTIPLAVCEKRTVGIAELRRRCPDVNLIVLDDGFQHRYVEPWINIVLMDYSNPIYEDNYLPLGTLRDNPSQLSRANIVLVTKYPDSIKPLDVRMVKKNLNLKPFQTLYFTRFENIDPQPLFPEEATASLKPGTPVVALTGIAKPEYFYDYLKKQFRIVEKVCYNDHHVYKMSEMKELQQRLETLPPETMIVTTEKDAVKLTNRKKISQELQRRLYYSPIRIAFMGNSQEDFCRQLLKYVSCNQKYSVVHPE